LNKPDSEIGMPIHALRRNCMICPVCSKPPLPFGAFVRKGQVFTLSCRSCGANLKVEPPSTFPVFLGVGLVLLFIILPFWGQIASASVLTLSLAFIAGLVALTVAGKAIAWKTYRYAAAPKAAGASAAR